MRIVTTLALLLLAPVTSAHAGVISGTVRVPTLSRDTHAFQPYAGKASSLPGHARPARGRVNDAVVAIDALPSDVAAALPEYKGARQLAQRDQSFVARASPVPRSEEGRVGKEGRCRWAA